jgi:uncharacterized protein YcaQ
VPDTCKVPWKSTGWTNDRNVTQLLKFMVLRGEVAIAGRQGRDRLWDLATRVYPDDPVVGVEEALRIRNERRLRALGQPFSGRAALLSPFDRLIHDRKRTVELFEFDHQLEMYKPAAKRRWGYFALPILYGDRLVGKLDAIADRKAGVLRINAIHQDTPFTRTMTAAVDREITDLARWLGLDLTRR